MSRPTVLLCLVLKHETPGAYMVTETEEDEKWISLPKSLVEMDATTPMNPRGVFPIHEFEIPEWLATEKGLI